MDVVDIHHLTKWYGKTKALNNVSFEVQKGELFGLLGPNGSGKSTMIKLLTGQIKPTKGTVNVLGHLVEKDPIAVREVVGIIPEQENPPSFLTAEEYLHFVGTIRKLKDIQHTIDAWFSKLDFDDQRAILCKDLSRGTRQKLMFAQAFLHNPSTVFIDEPLVNLDPISQRVIKDFLKEETKKGTTIFLSTHDLEVVSEICTKVVILKKGHVIYDGKPMKRLEKFFIESVNNA